ncbi:MAG: hypothetical protein ABGY96_08425 [bacterium]|nr:hypothetical protein [Gammaproteobacteria bacterium]HIL96381.1 hypothetical protein [Pseudomonadales bacterium]
MNKSVGFCVRLITVFVLTSCQSPTLLLPGKELQGTEAITDSFAFASEFSVLQLEVNPPAPYSVNLRITVIDGELYIDAAKKRRWYQYLATNRQVRVRLDGKIYDALAVPVTDADIKSRFRKHRVIFRLEPI